ncbi:MAG: carbohydrate-binding family 9-like protein [Firmicutes bacterium]|nr:carbohydrate-binding family 9-like protein [Bacillota bacterium]
MLFTGVQVPAIPFRPRSYFCRRATGVACIDGRIDKRFWDGAPWTEDFVDITGDERRLPGKRTRVKMLWDDAFLYVAAELEENEIWAKQTEHDSVIFQDNDFELFIDPDGDTHAYYEVEINAIGTTWDLLLIKPYRDGGPAVNGWELKGMRAAVHVDGRVNDPGAPSRSWSVELALPWSSLCECARGGMHPRAGDYWRLNFSRVEWRADVVDGMYKRRVDEGGTLLLEDNWVWSPMGIVNMHYPEMWGFVVFTDDGSVGEFAYPGVEEAKWRLRQLYYAQRNFSERHGQFTDDLAALCDGWDWPLRPRIQVTDQAFEMSLAYGDGLQAVCIREDGLVWTDMRRTV